MFSPKPQLSPGYDSWRRPCRAPYLRAWRAKRRAAAARTRREARAQQVGVYQSAWTAVPLCSVATVPLALHSTMALRSCQLSIASCQCLGTPAGDS